MTSFAFYGSMLCHRQIMWSKKNCPLSGTARRGLRIRCGGAVCSPCLVARRLRSHRPGMMASSGKTVPMHGDSRSGHTLLNRLGAHRPNVGVWIVTAFSYILLFSNHNPALNTINTKTVRTIDWGRSQCFDGESITIDTVAFASGPSNRFGAFGKPMWFYLWSFFRLKYSRTKNLFVECTEDGVLVCVVGSRFKIKGGMNLEQ